MTISQRVGAPAAVAILVTALAACTARAHDNRPDGFDTGPRRDPAWSARMPDRFGLPLRAQVTGDAVVVESSGGVAVFARSDGALRWQRPLQSSRIEIQTRVAGTTLAIEDGDRVRLVDLATGTVRADLPHDPRSVPVLTTTGVHLIEPFAPRRGWRVATYDLTGTKRWEREFAEPAQLVPRASAGFADPLAAAPVAPLLVTTRDVGSPTAKVVALAPDTGVETGRFAGPSEYRFSGYGGVSQAGDTLVAWDSDDTDCSVLVVAFDVATGARRWQAEFGRLDLYRSTEASTCGALWEPLVTGGHLLATTSAGLPQVRDILAGTVRWTGPSGTLPLALAGDTVVTRAGNGLGDLVAVDVTTGADRWRLPLSSIDSRRLSTLNLEHAAVGETFVFTVESLSERPDEGRTIVAYDLRAGRPRWSFGPGLHLLGAGAEGVVAASYPSSNPLDPGPVEIRFLPSVPA
jgi:outer membrane protein assembly factor BamB